VRKSRFLKVAVGVFFVVAVLGVSLVSFRGSVNEPAKPTFVRSHALFGSNSMMISGNTQVYSIGSIADQTEQAEGHIRSNGPITISGSNHINGSATAGPGYSVTITGGKNQVLGTTGSADAPLDAQVALSQEWLAYAQQSNNNSSIPSQYLDSNGNLKVTGNKTCALPAGTYYLNGITLSGSGKVVLEGNAVFVTYGAVTLSGNSRLNYNDSPSKCLMVSTASAHTFSGSSKGSFELFSPSAAVSITGNYEAIANYWARTITLSGSAQIKRLVTSIPPTIQILSPSNDSIINTGTPYLKVTYSSNGGTLDLSSLEVKIDDTLINWLNVTETQADGTIPQALSEGTHSISARIVNGEGIEAEAQSVFTVDTIAPVITISSPQDGFVTNNPGLVITGSLSEQATLILNGEIVSLDGSYAFSKSVTLAQGTNQFSFTATDPAGNISSVIITVVLDTVAPVITIAFPAEGFNTNIPTQTITGSLSKQAALTMNGEAVLVDESLAFSKQVILTEGQNVFNFNATDSAGNTSSHVLNVVLDTVAPVITIAAPQEGFLTNVSSQTITGSLGKQAVLTINGETVPVAGDLSFSKDVILTEGSNEFLLSAIDTAGNTTSSILHLILDTGAPVITISSPQEGFLTNNAELTITGSVSKPATIAVNGEAVTLNEMLAFQKSVNLTEGMNEFNFSAMDAAGNSASLALHVTLDTIPPAISIIQPEDGFITNNTDQTITGSLSGPAMLTMNGETVPLDGSFAFARSVTLVEGANEFNFIAVDTAGNSSSHILHITYDSGGPVITISSPQEGTLTNVSSHTITGSVSENCSLDMNGESVVLDEALSFSKGVVLTEGINEFEFIAEDTAGNTGSSILHMTLDTTAPQAVNVTLVTVSPSASGVVTISGSASAAEAGSVVTAENASTSQVVSTTAAGDGSFLMTIGGQENDQISLKSEDAVGNESSTISVIVPSSGGGGGELPPDPVEVATQLDPTVPYDFHTATQFLYSGDNPIQTDMTATIEPYRASVIRGITRDVNGQPLSGVKVSILNKPEYGYTVSREDGVYDLAENGGGVLTLKFEKAGFIPCQRNVGTPWRDFAWCDDVVLVQYDQNVTAIASNSSLTQVARGSLSQDVDGSRRATLAFQPGTSASIILQDGTVEQIASLNVRLTEFTVGENGPKAMPAILPPQSGYTYCVELSADEAVSRNARKVEFSQPVSFYLENFLNLPTGVIVPVGFYEKELGRWVASDNGKVITILSISSGYADLDVDGSGLAAGAEALATLGITDQERQTLAGIYPVGHSLWRAQVSHFSTIDLNLPQGPPTDAEGPNEKESEEEENRNDDCYGEKASIIAYTNRTLMEKVPITGTPYSLVYSTEKVSGRTSSTSLKIFLTGDTVPASLKSVKVKIEVAGRVFEQEYSPAANIEVPFNWDGNDCYGRPVSGNMAVKVKKTLVYPGMYYATREDKAQAFGTYPWEWYGSTGASSNYQVLGGRNGYEFLYSKDEQHYYANTLGNPKADGQKMGGWSVDVHHVYDKNSQTIYFGNGDVRSAELEPLLVPAFAGNGSWGYSGDGGQAGNAMLSEPMGICSGPDGSIFIADSFNCVVRKVAPDGVISTYAGNGVPGWSGDQGPATSASIRPYALAMDHDGVLYISEWWNNRIRKVTPDGIIDTIAGMGEISGWEGPEIDEKIRVRNKTFSPPTNGNIGDGAQAVDAKITPREICLDGAGNLYVLDVGCARVRRINTNGIITTIAGGGENFPDDGMTATNVYLIYPTAIAVSRNGVVYFTDSMSPSEWFGALRYIDQTGKINSILLPDVPNRMNVFNYVRGLFLTEDGKFYVSDGDRLTIVHTVYDSELHENVWLWYPIAGGGAFEGPGALAGTSRKLVEPNGIAVDPEGRIFVADRQLNQVLLVANYLASDPPSYYNVDKLIPSDDGTEMFAFDRYGRHISTYDSLTGVVKYSFAHDAKGLLTSITDRFGNITVIERDSSGNATGILSPYGQRTSLSMDPYQYASSIADPRGGTYEFTYNTHGLLTSTKVPTGGVSTYTYDAWGKLLLDEDAAGGSTTLEELELEGGTSVKKTTGEGRDTTFNFMTFGPGQGFSSWVESSECTCYISSSGMNNDGSYYVNNRDGSYITTIIKPDPRFGLKAPIPYEVTMTTPSGLSSTVTTTRSVDLQNQLSVLTQTDTVSLNGRTTTSVFDGTARTMTTTSPAGRVTTSRLDSLGRTISQEIPDLSAIQFGYDARGRLSTLSQGARSVGLLYDTLGNLSSVTDPLSRTVNFAYDASGRVTSQTFPDGRSASFGYDASGNVTSVTPPGKPAHTFTYTPVDLQATYTPPDIGIGDISTSYSYNLDRQLTRIDRPDGKSVSLSYNGAGRLSSVSSPDGSTSLTYNGETGQLVSIQGDDGTTNGYTYDGFLPLSETWSGAVNGAVTRTFNNDFQLASTAISGGSTIPYAYDNDGLLTGVGGLTLSRGASNGLLESATLGSVTDTYAYNSFGEVSTYTAAYPAGLSCQITYTRDTIGRITAKSEDINGITTTWGYTYDTAGRLTQTTKNGDLWASYGYDTNGNRLTKTTSSQTISGTYDAQDRLLAYGNYIYTYTANGELESKTNTATSETTTYTYDVLGNLKTVLLPDGTQIDYIIDGRNRRVGKKVNGTMERQWIYDGQLRPVAELDGTGALVSQFVYATHINVPDFIIKGATTYRVITDHLGSLRFVINVSDGTIAQRMDYDDWGNVLVNTAPDFTPFGFAGGMYDSQIKLTRFGARDYDAECGRWTAKDPIGFKGSQYNIYEYVKDDPINFIDITGLGFVDFGLNIPIPFLLGGIIGLSLDLQFEPNTGCLMFVPGLYAGVPLPGGSIIFAGGSPSSGFQSSISGGWYLGGMISNDPSGKNWSGGLGFVTPGFAVEALQYGIKLMGCCK